MCLCVRVHSVSRRKYGRINSKYSLGSRTQGIQLHYCIILYHIIPYKTIVLDFLHEKGLFYNQEI